MIALEGDGSILMSLGCLSTIGTVRPRNLTIVIMDNGLYQITGKQTTATGNNTDIVAVAKGVGLANSQWVRDDKHFDELIDRAVSTRAGRCCWRSRSTTSRAPGRPSRDPALIRNRFMKGLGTGRGGALDA